MAKTGVASFRDVLDEEKAHIGQRCGLARAFDQMDASFADEVRHAMGASEITAAAISRTLYRFGYPIGEGSVRRCRRICDCWKTQTVPKTGTER